MHVSITDRTIALNAREFAEFTTGPGAGGYGRMELWRAQLGQVWHENLRQQLAAADPAARFEVPIEATVPWRGWRVTLTGRVDQVVFRAGTAVVREVKTVMQPLPADPLSLRNHYTEYFRQLAVYQCLHREPGTAAGILAGELVFVEPATGITQVITQDPEAAHAVFDARLAELCGFAEQRRAGLERLRTLRFAPAFTTPRPGQESILADLRAAASRSPVVLFEAPTGYGKTGCALEYALDALATGQLTRLIYLTGKSTGQLEVVRQIRAMVGDPPGASFWQIRSKAEHCIHDTFHCVHEVCPHLADQDLRWPASGLQRFAQDPSLPRDLEALRAAGRAVSLCPYEITRASLPFADIWIADYNYIFAPANRGFLADMPGFEPAQTLLVIDEAHNLPSRVADAYSSELSHEAARVALAALEGAGATAALTAAWEQLALFLGRVDPIDELPPDAAADLHDLLGGVAGALHAATLDLAALGPAVCDTLFQAAGLHATAESGGRMQPELLWSPARGVVRFTCTDASAAIAETLHDFGHVVFLSATLSPVDSFLRSCGLTHLDPPPAHLVAPTPWRDAAYDVAIDGRVDTRYEHRVRHEATTARTIAALKSPTEPGPVVAFFPSFAYATRIEERLRALRPDLRCALQPRGVDLPAQREFIEESLLLADIILLVLGGTFAEGIDLLGGRVSRALVVGPALPEVNAIQRARLASSRAPDREAAFREVYQIPGMIKVNQALGRLVRAPGQRAKVLLHCRRFALPAYRSLLAPEYRDGAVIATEAELTAWIEAPP
ncbi:MAG: helicase [Opitutaceae bacterium]|nr:helicase [Opitutaceae bacterium]